MRVLAFVRNRTFWLMDLLKGSPVRHAYDDIKKFDEMDSINPFLRKYQKQAWLDLKEKACRTTRAYEKYVKCDFSEFPVITKQDIRQNQDDYISSDFVKEDLIQMATSGSTGTPFVCYQNAGKKRRVHAEIIYYSEKVGYRLGENLSYIRTVVKRNKKSGFKQWMQNQTLINCSSLSNSGIEQLIRSIQKQSQKGPVTLLGYGSTYTALKDYFLKHDVEKLEKCCVEGVLSGSDMLFDETREVVGKVFGNVPVVSRYSNEENGVLGQDEGMNNVFVINEADYLIEILDESGAPLPEGIPGRIVVTDLFNYAMPMIRYDTGDMGAVRTYTFNGKKKRCICQFGGRKVDVIFDADGKAISPHTVTNAMWDFQDITQFQLIQTGEGAYTLKLNVGEEFCRERQLVGVLQEVLGAKAAICVERVDEIPVLASGKRRYIVNEWKNI